MENNFPLSAQIGLFPEHRKKEEGIIYVIGLCCFKTRNPHHHHHHQLLCILHLKFKLLVPVFTHNRCKQACSIL